MSKKKNPILATLLSFIFPGAGQAYNGEKIKAAVLIILSLMILYWESSILYEYIEIVVPYRRLGLNLEVRKTFGEPIPPNPFVLPLFYIILSFFSAYQAYSSAKNNDSK